MRKAIPSARYTLAGAVFSLFFAYAVVEGVRFGLETENWFLVGSAIFAYLFTVFSEVLAYRSVEGDTRAYLFGSAIGFGIGVLLTPVLELMVETIAWGSAYLGGYIVRYLPSPYVINVFYGFLNALVIYYAIFAFRSLVDGIFISTVVSYRKTPSLLYGLLTPIAVFGVSTTLVLSTVGFIYVIYLTVVLLPFAILVGLFTSVLVALGAYMIVKYVFTPITNVLSNVLGELGDGAIVSTEDIEAGRPIYLVLLLSMTLLPFAGVERYLSMALGLSMIVVAGALSTVSSIAPIARRVRYLQQLITLGLNTLGLSYIILASVASPILKYAIELAIESIGGVSIPLPF